MDVTRTTNLSSGLWPFSSSDGRFRVLIDGPVLTICPTVFGISGWDCESTNSLVTNLLIPKVVGGGYFLCRGNHLKVQLPIGKSTYHEYSSLHINKYQPTARLKRLYHRNFGGLHSDTVSESLCSASWRRQSHVLAMGIPTDKDKLEYGWYVPCVNPFFEAATWH